MILCLTSPIIETMLGRDKTSTADPLQFALRVGPNTSTTRYWCGHSGTHLRNNMSVFDIRVAMHPQIAKVHVTRTISIPQSITSIYKVCTTDPVQSRRRTEAQMDSIPHRRGTRVSRRMSRLECTKYSDDKLAIKVSKPSALSRCPLKSR